MANMKHMNNTILIDADDEVKSQVGRIMETLSYIKVDLQKLKDEIRSLLEHLSTNEGRTDKNCKAVDSYFMNNDLWAIKELPDELHDILADISGALHDTVSSPEIANNFESTPKQLLERLKKVRIEQQL